MRARYLNLSELAHVRWRAEQSIRWRRPRRAKRVRAFAVLWPSSNLPRVPAPRRPVDVAGPVVLQRVLEGLKALPGVV
ncbi:hypothetical protein [Nocardiopsis sp. MG754419]|uniref:hypothetical protein n=1 Tax=Nocardiopsis sp. MG754419 TaxID=2259865 RepID=UPI001BA5652D|nr:hypothetical protein [Nocardiopsis sp. MG754419]MBR8742693.1 hypothetical protein [Nocardiopsis sp. MG754419]